MAPREFFASCLAGAERLLADELKGLGIGRVRPLKGGVAFFCDPEGAYRACLWSRIASRIVLVIDRVDASDAESLYRGIAAVPWEEVLAVGAAFAVRAHGTNSQLRNTRFTALKAKDAIADRLRGCRKEEAGPEGAGTGPRASIDVRLRGERAAVSLDFCGEALNHRPYLFEDDGPDAPLRCSFAAIALAFGRWQELACGGAPLVDPCCGDGIVLVEAAAMACDRAPALGRARWGFTGWHSFDPRVWDLLVEEARDRFREGLAAAAPAVAGSREAQGASPRAARFIGACTSSPAISKARKYVRRAGLQGVASVELGDAAAMEALVQRVRRCSGSGPDDPCAVAGSIEGRRRDDAAAAVKADEAAMAAAVRAAGEQCTTIAIDGQDMLARFGEDSRRSLTVGSGRLESCIEVFEGPLQAGAVIETIDLDSGEPRAIEVYEATSGQFAARLRKMLKERRKQAAREDIGCFRIYDYDLPEYAVAIDWYQGPGRARGNSYLSIAEYAPPASVDEARARRRFHDVLAIAAAVCGVRPDHIFSKRRVRDKGGSQYGRSQGRSYATTVQEGGYLFEVDLAKRLDTGLFLDHRLTRQLVGRMARGARFLNLFAYTGTASVYAAGGGAVSTLTVDLSQTYLDWARRNMEANGFTGACHSFQKADALQWVTRARRQRDRYDLIFVDPPTFSNSKAMGRKTWDVQRDHAELLIGVVHLLAPDGCAVFSCNLRNFKPDMEKLRKYGVELEDITPDTIPFDFVRTPRIHRCFLVRRAK